MTFGDEKYPHLRESSFRDDFRRWKASSFERKPVQGLLSSNGKHPCSEKSLIRDALGIEKSSPET